MVTPSAAGTRTGGPVGAALAALALLGCRPAPETPLGPADSFVLLVRDADGKALRRADPADPDAAALTRVLLEPFGAELLRVVYMVKQFLAQGEVDGAGFDARARAVGGDALALALGEERPHGLGMTLAGSWLGGPVTRPDAAWVGLPGGLRDDPALVQTVAGRVAAFLAHLVASGARWGDEARAACGSPALEDGYRMAIEVIAREWRSREGAAGRLDPNAGSAAQRELFARVRENAFVHPAGQDGALRPARELLDDAGVAATVIYRLSQNRKLAQAIAEPGFYRPLAGQHIPPGISPAVVLGAFRNLQAKLLVPWLEAARRGQAPCDIADLIALHARRFPDEAEEALRVFVVTTHGATVLPGGVPVSPAEPTAALARLDALVAELRAGARGLRDALGADRPARSEGGPP